jgi:hypothetical protein
MKSKNQKPVVPIMFEDEMKKKIEAVAKKEGRTFAGQIRHVLTKWLEINCFILLICLFLVSCSNPVKPNPKGLCVLEPIRGGGLFDTVVTCEECHKIASYGYYYFYAFTPGDTVQAWKNQ